MTVTYTITGKTATIPRAMAEMLIRGGAARRVSVEAEKRKRGRPPKKRD